MDLNHLHLHVRDVEHARAFYEEHFDFRERVRHGDILFLRNREGFDLALAPDAKADALPRWFHFGFRLPSPADVRRVRERLGEIAGEIHDEEDLVTFRCRDPDGYGIEVYWEP